jgi:poly(hydroxyalkanoate) depolymerase family esterase
MKIFNGLVSPLFKTPSAGAAHSAQSFDTGGITGTIRQALASAGLDTQSGIMKNVPDTISHALSSAGLTPPPAPESPNGMESPSGMVIEGVAREIFPRDDDSTHIGRAKSAEHIRPGEFLSRSFSNTAGTRAYKLYVPASYSESPEKTPLVVLLHGCTQSPDDFAAGTRMNALAESHGFLVAYPAQAAHANGKNCWNWFRAEDQSRDRGEPSLIAGITCEIASRYRVDDRRIFVAGLSAGGAMAVVLGATYPELYTAVGAHSGLPYGVAHDVPSAFRAMQTGGAPADAFHGPAVPTIVFHGDCDHTVNAANSAAIVAQALKAHTGYTRLSASVNESEASGRTFSRTVYTDAANQPIVEQWVLHGAGHAWSGGNPQGSFTDMRGPDASAEMIRFFHAQRRAGTA